MATRRHYRMTWETKLVNVYSSISGKYEPHLVYRIRDILSNE